MRPPLSAKDLALSWLPLFFTLCFLAGSLLQVRSFVVNDADFSYFLTQPWRIWTFGDWDVPFAADQDHAPFWAHHLTPLSALLAPLIGLFPSPYTLAVVHGLAAGLMAFLLPRLVRCVYRSESVREGEKRLPERAWLWTALALLLIFFSFRPWLAAWTRQTHFTTLVAPLLALGCLALHKGRPGLVLLCALLVCLGQERASVAVFGLGMYAWLLLGKRRMALALCLLSCLWFFGATQWWLPLMREHAGLDTAYAFSRHLAPLKGWDEKFVLLGWLCVYTGFLPFCGLRALRAAACALPALSLSLVSSPGYHMLHLNSQYFDLPSVFLLLSMIYGMRRLQCLLAPGRWKPLFAAGTGVYCALMLASQTGWYNPLLTTVRLLTAPNRQELAMLRKDLQRFRPLPAGVNLYAQSGLGPHLALFGRRVMAHAGQLRGPLREALFVISPKVGNAARIPASHQELARLADAHPDLFLVLDTGRVRVYASRDLAEAQPELLERLRGAPGGAHRPAQGLAPPQD